MAEETDFLFADYDEREAEVKPAQKKFSYNAKVCDTEWFLTADQPVDAIDAISYFKFRADLFFKKKQFEKAYAEYTKCRDLAPPKNSFMQMDVIESQVRCLVNMYDPPTDPVKLAQTLFDYCKNDIHVMNGLLLLQYVYNKLEMIQDEIVILQKCLVVHYQTADLWMKIAGAYRKLFKLDHLDVSQASVSILTKGLESVSMVDFSTNQPTNMVLEKQFSSQSEKPSSISGDGVDNSLEDHIEIKSETENNFNNYRTDFQGNITRNKLCSSSSAAEDKDIGCDNSCTIDGNQVHGNGCILDTERSSDCSKVINYLETEMPGELVVLMCLFRARSLLAHQRDLVGLASENNNRQLDMVQAQIEQIQSHTPDDIINAVRKAMYLNMRKFREWVLQTKIDLKNDSFKDAFENSYFSWPVENQGDAQLPSSMESLEDL